MDPWKRQKNGQKKLILTRNLGRKEKRKKEKVIKARQGQRPKKNKRAWFRSRYAAAALQTLCGQSLLSPNGLLIALSCVCVCVPMVNGNNNNNNNNNKATLYSHIVDTLCLLSSSINLLPLSSLLYITLSRDHL